ncbi:hypothetical protein VTI74DRAFT_5451 [Chaetomium olivicolor]
MNVGDGPMSVVVQGAALVSLIWSCTVFLVQAIGIFQLFRNHSAPHPKPMSPGLKEDEVPHITIIRPVKGVDAGLYECLASSFHLAYPKSKLTIYLCVASTDDPAYPVLQQVVADFPGFDAKVLVEEDDPLLHGTDGHVNNLGPNPKIRNISRAYREAKGDIIWIVDCNVWVGRNSAGRMVDKLCGYLPDGSRTAPYKFVHQLPLVVDIEPHTTITTSSSSPEEQSLLPKNTHNTIPHHLPKSILDHGGRLEETFMSTTHAKFYSAINTVSLAPCIVGKSNMFRRSHLDRLTTPSLNPLLSPADALRGRGLDFFSSYICEDHLIGDLIWRSRVPGFKNHGLVGGEVAVQPMSGMSVAGYIGRRVRWLRVRKWTVLAATLVEPGVESLLCCAHFAFAVTTLEGVRGRLEVPGSWGAMGLLWIGAVTTWMLVDRWVSSKLKKFQSVEVDENTPSFARGAGRNGGIEQRPFAEWLAAWLGRELLALPIWTWAVLLGTTVTWRGKQFRVRMDMSVVEVEGRKGVPSTIARENSRPNSRNKDRVE